VASGPVPEVVVEDHGVGIPNEMRELIFERFYRIDHPEPGPQPGTGLGLFIGRELAQRLGGSLVLDWTEVGKGSRFVLRLPAAAPEEHSPPSGTASPEPAPRRRARLAPLEESRSGR
jgi:signal transduction histidine kinase